MPPSADDLKTGNRLLDALASKTLARLRPHLNATSLPFNKSMQEPGERAEHVIFPTSGMISAVSMMEDGQSVEVGMIGKEGMHGVSAVLGDDSPSQRAMVQIAGSGLRITLPLIRQEMQADAAFHALLLRYTQVTLSTAVQSAACNRLHLLEQRAARWLLSAHDRAEADTFPMTHEFLAIMLGVRRPGVTIAAQSLQASGLITYNHGTLSVLDRAGLEAASCECYRFVRDEYDRLLGRLS
jgi:CRP-like cAMP-binding protein